MINSEFILWVGKGELFPHFTKVNVLLNQGVIRSLYAKDTYAYVHLSLLRNIAFHPEAFWLK